MSFARSSCPFVQGAPRRPNRCRCGIHRRIEELLSGELRAIVHDDGVWDPKAMDDVKEEQYSLLGLDYEDRSSLYPLCKLVYGDKQVRIASGRPLRGSTRSSPQTANGHVMGIVWSAWADRWVYRA